MIQQSFWTEEKTRTIINNNTWDFINEIKYDNGIVCPNKRGDCYTVPIPICIGFACDGIDENDYPVNELKSFI